MALLIVQLAPNRNQHFETEAAERANRIDRGNPLRVVANRSEIGVRFLKSKWIASGRPANDFPMSFVVVEITDMTDAQAAKLCEQYPPFDENFPDDPITFSRRWVFVASGIAPERQNELLTSGELVTNKSLMSAALIDQAGELTLDDL